MSVSPTSTSEKVFAANWKLNEISSVAFWLGIGLATVGASLTLATTMLKVSETVPPLPSLAVTSIEIVPISEFDGVPLKVRVRGSKLSQAGNAPPPFNWAE